MDAIAVRDLGRLGGSPLRKAFVVMVTSAAGMALLSCSAVQPSAVQSSTSSTVYEPSAPIARAPLSAPVGYASPSPLLNAQTTSPPYASHASDPETASFGTWRASPRWAAVKGDGCIVVDQESEAAGAAKFRVGNCLEEDASRLSVARPDAHDGPYIP
jgi:hypothetical protein